MTMLLLIRSADDMRSAIKAANEFLLHRRQRFARNREEEDRILGIWLRGEVDAELPAWSGGDHELGKGPSAEDTDESSESNPPMSDVRLGIRESFSLSGIWALCWVDGSSLRSARDPAERRRVLLHSLVGVYSAPLSRETGVFFPVFHAGESVERIEATMNEFRDRHPNLVAAKWFIDDWECGVIPA